MTAYSNPRMSATIHDWPSGSQPGTAHSPESILSAWPRTRPCATTQEPTKCPSNIYQGDDRRPHHANTAIEATMYRRHHICYGAFSEIDALNLLQREMTAIPATLALFS